MAKGHPSIDRGKPITVSVSLNKCRSSDTIYAGKSLQIADDTLSNSPVYFPTRHQEGGSFPGTDVGKDVAMRVCLFEDRGVVDLEPLTLTRPVFDLLWGQGSLATKQARLFRSDEVGYLVRPFLADVSRLQHG